MLKKPHTIRKQKEIKEVFKLGKTYKTKELLLKIKDNNLEKYRMTVVVSSKVSSKAVDRNRLKRQIKSFFLEEIKNNYQEKDFIFITLSNIKKLSAEEIKERVKRLMNLV